MQCCVFLVLVMFMCLILFCGLFADLTERRHLEKSQRIEAILASLQASGAETTQLAEVEEMITAPERQQLEALRHHINKYCTTSLY